jgi:mannose-6-phosphate isomerase-like protein (cupin superfamily)
MPFLSLAAAPAAREGGLVQTEPIRLSAALDTFTDHWQPRIIANFNDYDVRVAKVLGEYVWHQHDDTDELFMVISGELSIDLEASADADKRTVVLPAGSVYVVPRGVRHRPRAQSEAALLVLDPTGTRSTGDFDGELPGHLVSTTGVPLG